MEFASMNSQKWSKSFEQDKTNFEVLQKNGIQALNSANDFSKNGPRALSKKNVRRALNKTKRFYEKIDIS